MITSNELMNSSIASVDDPWKFTFILMQKEIRDISMYSRHCPVLARRRVYMNA